MSAPRTAQSWRPKSSPRAPSRWYLTGFLVPLEAAESQKSDETANEDFNSPAAGGDATDDDTTPESPAARRAFFPSSIGLSLLVSKQTRQLRLEVDRGDYRAEPLDAPVDGEESPAPEVSGRMPMRWRREANRVEMTLNLPTETAKAVEHEVPDSDGLHGAACHGCLLIAETSCEQHNDFLDRALVISTADGNGAEFFRQDGS